MDKIFLFGDYLLNHALEVIGLLVAYLSFFLPIKQYLGQKNIEEKDKRFNNYHRLIGDLVGVNAGPVMMDKQIAVIFELRNYPEYYDLTKRILRGLLDDWNGTKKVRVIREIELTIEFIENK